MICDLQTWNDLNFIQKIKYKHFLKKEFKRCKLYDDLRLSLPRKDLSCNDYILKYFNKGLTSALQENSDFFEED